MSVITGSNAARRLACPSSYKLEQAMPRVESEHAALGTALHEAIAEYCTELLPNDLHVSTLEGQTFKGIEITHSLILDKLQPAAEALQELIERAGGFSEVFIEEKISYLGGNNYIDFYGKGIDGKMYVIDFKFGDGVPVDPFLNKQLLFYACAVWNDTQIDAPYVLGIIQPILGVDGSALKTWNYVGVDAIQDWHDLFSAAKDLCQSADDSYYVGSHCRFCKANAPGVCPKKTAVAIELSEDAFLQPPQPMQPDVVARYLELAEQIEPAIKTLRAHAHAQLEQGVDIPGYKVVAKRGRRVYTDETAVTGLLDEELGAGAYIRKLISPAQAEKALGKPRYKTLLSDLVAMVSSGTTMVKENDSRPAILSPRQIIGDKAKDLPKPVDFRDIERKRD